MQIPEKPDRGSGWILGALLSDLPIPDRGGWILGACLYPEKMPRFQRFKFNCIFIFQVEVFNVLYVTEQDRKFVVHCLHCALRIDPTLKSFTVLNQYTKEELASVYEQFTVIPVSDFILKNFS